MLSAKTFVAATSLDTNGTISSLRVSSKNAESFSVKPVDNAGKTEIRVYYGGISFALGAFLLYLTLKLGTPVYSLVGGLYFSTTVFVTRTIFLCVDKGWKCPYTKLAIPAEGFFAVALWICYILSKVLY